MMGIKKLSWLVGTVVVATLGMQINVQAQGHAVVDISEWQGQLSPSQVQAMKSQVLFVINRRQYGLNYVDRDAANNTALYVRYGIPFGEYDFSQFTDAVSARREAQAFYARSNKAARFYALDFEVNTVRSGSTNAAVAAWYHEMRALTNKKLIFYSYASFALTYANQARQRFDAQWIGALTPNPPIVPAALWQYTDRYHLAGLAAPVDNSRVITSVHSVSWWLGTDRVARVVTSNTQPRLKVVRHRRLTAPARNQWGGRGRATQPVAAIKPSVVVQAQPLAQSQARPQVQPVVKIQPEHRLATNQKTHWRVKRRASRTISVNHRKVIRHRVIWHQATPPKVVKLKVTRRKGTKFKLNTARVIKRSQRGQRNRTNRVARFKGRTRQGGTRRQRLLGQRRIRRNQFQRHAPRVTVQRQQSTFHREARRPVRRFTHTRPVQNTSRDKRGLS